MLQYGNLVWERDVHQGSGSRPLQMLTPANVRRPRRRTIPNAPYEQQVVDNPQFGLARTLRAVALHALVLYAGIQLVSLGWCEFHEWGEGKYGQVKKGTVFILLLHFFVNV